MRKQNTQAFIPRNHPKPCTTALNSLYRIGIALFALLILIDLRAIYLSLPHHRRFRSSSSRRCCCIRFSFDIKLCTHWDIVGYGLCRNNDNCPNESKSTNFQWENSIFSEFFVVAAAVLVAMLKLFWHEFERFFLLYETRIKLIWISF